jgi:hypothetical protein
MARSSIGAELVATLLANRWRAIETPDQQISSIVECIVKHRPTNGTGSAVEVLCPSRGRLFRLAAAGSDKRRVLAFCSPLTPIRITSPRPKIFHLIMRIDSPASHQPLRLTRRFLLSQNYSIRSCLPQTRGQKMRPPRLMAYPTIESSSSSILQDANKQRTRPHFHFKFRPTSDWQS